MHSPFYSSNTCLTHAQELLVGLSGLLGNTGTVMEGSGFVGTDEQKHGMGSKPAHVQVPQVHSGTATAKGQLPTGLEGQLPTLCTCHMLCVLRKYFSDTTQKPQYTLHTHTHTQVHIEHYPLTFKQVTFTIAQPPKHSKHVV